MILLLFYTMTIITDLPLEIFYHFRDYLCYVDIQALRLTCKYLNELPQKEFKQLLLKKLEKHLVNPQELLDVIDQVGGCISGSFILAVLYDLDFYSNITIYENPKIEIDEEVYNMTFHTTLKSCQKCLCYNEYDCIILRYLMTRSNIITSYGDDCINLYFTA